MNNQVKMAALALSLSLFSINGFAQLPQNATPTPTTSVSAGIPIPMTEQQAFKTAYDAIATDVSSPIYTQATTVYEKTNDFVTNFNNGYKILEGEFATLKSEAQTYTQTAIDNAANLNKVGKAYIDKFTNGAQTAIYDLQKSYIDQVMAVNSQFVTANNHLAELDKYIDDAETKGYNVKNLQGTVSHQKSLSTLAPGQTLQDSYMLAAAKILNLNGTTYDDGQHRADLLKAINEINK